MQMTVTLPQPSATTTHPAMCKVQEGLAKKPLVGKDRSLAGDAYCGGVLRSKEPSQSYSVGDFLVTWSLSEGLLSVVHVDRPKDVVWANFPHLSFLTAGHGQAVFSDKRGFFRVKENLQSLVREQVLESFQAEGESLTLTGSFIEEAGSLWEIKFSAIDDQQLSLTAHATLEGRPCNRLCLVAASRASEEFFGFGAQFTHLHMKGRRMPIICQEPGIGRGIQPLTGVMEKLFGAGGAWWQTYASVPTCMSTDLRGLCLENTEYSVFDLRPDSYLRVGVFAEQLRARIFCGACPLSMLEAYTSFCGRMRMMPDWVQNGAIIGAQGGTAKVKATLAKLEKQNVPISAVWLQDWVGKRKTAAGSQLWWSWELNREHYPEWETFVETLRSKGIRVLTYINPFLVDASSDRNLTRDLHAEANEKGYFVKRADGTPYPIGNTTFSASMIDLSNLDCRQWIKGVITENLIGVGCSGWMLDYAEALPFDAHLQGHPDAASYHNAYPIEWAKVSREAIEEAGLGDEILFFSRSAFHCSPRYSTAFWTGDHLTSWRKEDGIKSVVVGLLSSGFCGMSLNHADIGGYTSTHVLPVAVPGITFTRSQELLMRWTELSAFTALFRTHEGIVPERNHQVTDAPDTLEHFARFARIYGVLADYRKRLCRDATTRGLPLVRHPWLHYPNDLVARRLELQFLFGEDFMVAPILDPGLDEGSIYLPAGKWVHLWSGQEVVLEIGRWCRCSAPIGYPPVFYIASSAAGEDMREKLVASADLGRAWTRVACRIVEDEVGDKAGNRTPRTPGKIGARGSRFLCCLRRRYSQVHVQPKEEDACDRFGAAELV